MLKQQNSKLTLMKMVIFISLACLTVQQVCPNVVYSNAQTRICFRGVHSHVSDLSFFLVGPPSCQSPFAYLNTPAFLLPNCVNDGDDFLDLCFTSTMTTSIFDICTVQTPITGNFSRFGNSDFGVIDIDWSLYDGCHPNYLGWKAVVNDC